LEKTDDFFIESASIVDESTGMMRFVQTSGHTFFTTLGSLIRAFNFSLFQGRMADLVGRLPSGTQFHCNCRLLYENGGTGSLPGHPSATTVIRNWTAQGGCPTFSGFVVIPKRSWDVSLRP